MAAIKLLKKLQLPDRWRIDVEDEQFRAERLRHPLCLGEIMRHPDMMKRCELA
jgi:hypothetical protein